MVKRGGQLVIEGTDTELSKACDELLECRTELVDARAKFNAAENAIIKLMSGTGKKSVKHDGYIIRWAHVEEKDKIQIKSSGD